MKYNLVSFIIIICMLGVIYNYITFDVRIICGVCTIAFILFFYMYLWKQRINVYPVNNYKKIDYRHQVLWINTNMLNVNNMQHKKWCKHILIENAPNRLGIYIDKKNISTLYVLKQIEIFRLMFNYECSDIYFKYRVSNEIRRFCEKKNLNIKYYSIRYTLL